MKFWMLDVFLILMLRDHYNNRNISTISNHTVDGRNPAPPGMYKILQIMGHLSYQLVQDFFHQQYQIQLEN